MAHLLLEDTLRDYGGAPPLSPVKFHQQQQQQQHYAGLESTASINAADGTLFSIHHAAQQSTAGATPVAHNAMGVAGRQSQQHCVPDTPAARSSSQQQAGPSPRTPQQQQYQHQPSPSGANNNSNQYANNNSASPSAAAHSPPPIDTWTSLNKAVAYGIHAAQIRHLAIESCELAESPWRWLLTVMPQLPLLEHLSLKDTAMTDARLAELTGLVCYTISRGAPTPAAIRHADMNRADTVLGYGPTAGVYAGSSMAPSLSSMTRLVSLNLADNYLTHRSALSIGKFCMWNLMNLQALDLSGNELGDHGAQVLSVYLSKMAPLRPSEAPITSRTKTAASNHAGSAFASRPRQEALRHEAQLRSELENLLNNIIKMVRPDAVDDAVEGLMSLCPQLRARASANKLSPSPNRVIPGGHHERHHRFGLVSLDMSENRLSPRGVAEILTGASKSQIRLLVVARNSPNGGHNNNGPLNTSGGYYSEGTNAMNFSSATTAQQQRLLGSGLASRSQIPIVSLATLQPSVHCRWRVLDLSGCGLGTVIDLPSTRRLLLSILFASQHLEVLDVGDNVGLGDVLARLLYDMGWEAAENGRAAPKSLSRLRSLRIANSGLTDVGAATLMHALLDFDAPVDVLGGLQSIDFGRNEATLSMEAHDNLVAFFSGQERPVSITPLYQMCTTHANRLSSLLNNGLNSTHDNGDNGDDQPQAMGRGGSGSPLQSAQQQGQQQQKTPPPSPRRPSYKVERSPDRRHGNSPVLRASSAGGAAATAAPTPNSVANISEVVAPRTAAGGANNTVYTAYDASPMRLDIVEEEDEEGHLQQEHDNKAQQRPHNDDGGAASPNLRDPSSPNTLMAVTRSRTRSPNVGAQQQYSNMYSDPHRHAQMNNNNDASGSQRGRSASNSQSNHSHNYYSGGAPNSIGLSPQAVWRQPSRSPEQHHDTEGERGRESASPAGGSAAARRLSPSPPRADVSHQQQQQGMTPPPSWHRNKDDYLGGSAGMGLAANMNTNAAVFDHHPTSSKANTNYLGLYSTTSSSLGMEEGSGGLGAASSSGTGIGGGNALRAPTPLSAAASGAADNDANGDDDAVSEAGTERKRKKKKVVVKKSKKSSRANDRGDSESVAPSECTNESRSVSPEADVKASSVVGGWMASSSGASAGRAAAAADDGPIAAVLEEVVTTITTTTTTTAPSPAPAAVNSDDHHHGDNAYVHLREVSPSTPRAQSVASQRAASTAAKRRGSSEATASNVVVEKVPSPAGSPTRAKGNSKDSEAKKGASGSIFDSPRGMVDDIAALVANDSHAAIGDDDEVSFALESPTEVISSPMDKRGGGSKMAGATAAPSASAIPLMPLFTAPKKDPSAVTGRVKGFTLTYSHPPGHILCQAWHGLHMHMHCERLWNARVGEGGAPSDPTEREETLAALARLLPIAAKQQPAVYGPIAAQAAANNNSTATLKLFYRTALTERALSLQRAMVADVTAFLQPSAAEDASGLCVESVLLEETDEMMGMCTFTIKTNERRMPIAQRLQDKANAGFVEPSSEDTVPVASSGYLIAAAAAAGEGEGDNWKHLRHYMHYCQIAPKPSEEQGSAAFSAPTLTPSSAYAPPFTQDEVDWYGRLSTALHVANAAGGLQLSCPSSCHLLHDHHGREDQLLEELPEDMAANSRRLRYRDPLVPAAGGDGGDDGGAGADADAARPHKDLHQVSHIQRNDNSLNISTDSDDLKFMEEEATPTRDATAAAAASATATPSPSDAAKKRGTRKGGAAGEEEEGEGAPAATAAVGGSPTKPERVVPPDGDDPPCRRHRSRHSDPTNDKNDDDDNASGANDSGSRTRRGHKHAGGEGSPTGRDSSQEGGGRGKNRSSSGGGDNGSPSSGGGGDKGKSPRRAKGTAEGAGSGGGVGGGGDSEGKSLSTLVRVEPIEGEGVGAEEGTTPKRDGQKKPSRRRPSAVAENGDDAVAAAAAAGSQKRRGKRPTDGDEGEDSKKKRDGEGDGNDTERQPSSVRDRGLSPTQVSMTPPRSPHAGRGGSSTTPRGSPMRPDRYVDAEEERAASVPAEQLVPIQNIIADRHQQQMDSSRGEFTQSPYAATPPREPQLDRAALFLNTLKEQRVQLLLALCYNSINQEHINLDEARRNKERVGKGKLRGKEKVSISIEWDQLLVIKRYRGFSQKQIIFMHPLVCSVKATAAGPKSKELLLTCEQPFGPEELGDKIKGTYQGTPQRKERLVQPDTTPGHDRLLRANSSDAAASASPATTAATPNNSRSGSVTPGAASTNGRSASPSASPQSQAQQFANRRAVTLSITLGSHKEVLKAIEVIHDHEVISHAHFDKMIQKRMDDFNKTESAQRERPQPSPTGAGAGGGVSRTGSMGGAAVSRTPSVGPSAPANQHGGRSGTPNAANLPRMPPVAPSPAARRANDNRGAPTPPPRG